MTDLPPDHPLHGKDVESHADHLAAYSDILAESDADAAMLVLTNAGGTDTLPTVAADTDPRWASLWMLGAHIHHVARSATGASGREMSMEEAAHHAIDYVREYGGSQEDTDGEM